MDVPDMLSFIWQIKEIFVDEFYRFESESRSPVIYDCGANIGMSCLYLKKLFPESVIKTFEADPNIIKYLKSNLKANNIGGVEVFEKAVWVHNEGVSFTSEGADGGAIFGEDSEKIPSLRLSDLIREEERVDFLKLDIEGAETEVMKDCEEVLHKVDHLFVEYHNIDTGPGAAPILAILERAGFKYHILPTGSKLRAPLLNLGKAKHKFNFQLNIFAKRKF